MSQDLELTNRRLKWLAITGWTCCVIAAVGVLVVWKRMDTEILQKEQEAMDRAVKALPGYLSVAKGVLGIPDALEIATFMEGVGGHLEIAIDHGVTVNLSGRNVSDAHLDLLRKICVREEPRTLNLSGTRVTEAGVRKLKESLLVVRIIR